MPRYFFHVFDGQKFDLDEEGTVLADLEEARRLSMITAGDMLQDAVRQLGVGDQWTMRVTDEIGRPVCCFNFSSSVDLTSHEADRDWRRLLRRA